MISKEEKRKTYYIVCIDDDEIFLNSLAMILPEKLSRDYPDYIYKFEFVSNYKELRELMDELGNENLAVVICDEKMPGRSGINILTELKTSLSPAARILLTGYSGLKTAKEAIINRVLDQYVTKPIDDYEQFVALLYNLIEKYHYELNQEEMIRKIYAQKKQIKNAREKINYLQKMPEEMVVFAKKIGILDLDVMLKLIVEKSQEIFMCTKVSIFLFESNSEYCSLKKVVSNAVSDNVKFEIDMRNSIPYKKIESDRVSGYYEETKLSLEHFTPIQKAVTDNDVIIIDDVKKSPLHFLNKKDRGKSCIVIPFSLFFGEVSPHFGGRYLHPQEAKNIGGVITVSGLSITSDEVQLYKYKAFLVRNIIGSNISNAQMYFMQKQNHSFVPRTSKTH